MPVQERCRKVLYRGASEGLMPDVPVILTLSLRRRRKIKGYATSQLLLELHLPAGHCYIHMCTSLDSEKLENGDDVTCHHRRGAVA